MAASCHGGTAVLDHGPATGMTARLIALVGNPNVGKSTVFNALTGAHQHVGNWPGKTVQVAQGSWRIPGEARLRVADLPGTYSLLPDSPDEELVRDLLTAPAGERPDLVLFALDAANPARNLYLLSQVLDTGLPVVVMLTMTDIAAKRGTEPDPEALAQALGLPVVAVTGRSGKGFGPLAEAVRRALAAPVEAPAWYRGTDLARTVDPLAEAAAGQPGPARWLALTLLCGERVPGTAEQLTVAAARAADELARADTDGADAELLIAEARYTWSHRVLEQAVRGPLASRATASDRVDRLLLSKWFGIPFFLAVMWGVFQATTTLAKPLQDGLGAFVSGPVSDRAQSFLDALHAPDWLSGLLVNGVVNGVGQLLTFVPLMVIMFLLLTLLEDSGYFARAAFVADRAMRALRLPGRAFLPLVVGFGCNVPALAGTRILKQRSHRLLVGLLIPYMSCTARLTVFAMIAGVFFGSNAGTVIFILYVMSVALVVVMGLILRPLLFKDMKPEPLVLELPPYRLPTLRVTGTQVWQRTAAFLKTAGGIIVATVAAVWLLMAVPAAAGAGHFGEVPVEQSVFGTVTETIAPVMAPAGFGDWHASAALTTGFVAKEGVVSTVAQTYGGDEDNDAAVGGQALSQQLHDTFEHSSGGHADAAAMAFLVFILAYTPCMATLAAQRVEIGTRLTLIGLGVQLVVAWLLAVGVFQFLKVLS
ncbi:ferrous iron transport protein B [Streptomyces monticola]|uniref:Ferrous iron transport protein B n=1 Tax=Streptomyces monticola TaxID=2666263 RepID=A0ABW2JNF7_9ACTN